MSLISGRPRVGTNLSQHSPECHHAFVLALSAVMKPNKARRTPSRSRTNQAHRPFSPGQRKNETDRHFQKR